MVVLLIGMLVGAAVIALAFAGSSRVTAALIGGLTLLGLACFLVATAPPAQTLRLILSLQLFPDPPPAAPVLWFLILLAALGGGALGWTWKAIDPPAEPELAAPPFDPREADRFARRARTAVEVRLLAVCLTFAVAGATSGQISLLRALLAGLFAAGAIIAGLETRDALREDRLEVRSSWGGLGGGLGGWEISRPTVCLLLALGFAGAALIAAGVPSPEFGSGKADTEKGKGQAAGTAATNAVPNGTEDAGKKNPEGK